MKDLENKSLHVLFADDDSDEVYLFREAIEQLGLPIVVSSAKDGNDLVNILLTAEPLPDLLLLDINMPYKDGIETLKEIRSDKKFDDMPVIIFSTSSNRVHAEGCYEFGADMYIVKPERFDDIIQMVKKIYYTNWEENKLLRNKEDFVIKF